jgi:hypothetical protein
MQHTNTPHDKRLYVEYKKPDDVDDNLKKERGIPI